MPRNAEVTRERILQAAQRLFFQRGFARVKMSDIAKAAGVTKRTLYHHYDSKDSLLEAMLEHQHELSSQTYAKSIADTDGGPASLVGRLFNDLEAWAQSEYYLGSGFTRLATELGDLRGHPAMQLAGRHKATIEDLLTDAFELRGAKNARLLAREVWILVEGAMVVALIHQDSEYVRVAKQAAMKLVQDAER